ncbi:MAG: S8 family serine peptidase [Candidatus Hodarchaeales archaeon]|jgi:hypothetical protein
MRRTRYPQRNSFIILLLIGLPLIGSFNIDNSVTFEISKYPQSLNQGGSSFSNQNDLSSSIPPDLLDVQSPLSIDNATINDSFDVKLNLINPLKDTSYTGSNVKIAILDSGINETDWISDNKIINRTNVGQPNAYVYDDIGHGTLVGSIVSKIAPEARILSIKVTDEFDLPTVENIEAGIRLALTYNVSIIHASFGSEDIHAINSSLISSLNARNVSFIVAAGNSGPFGSSITSPAVFNEAISVGMTYNQTYIPYSSSVGPRPTGGLGPDIVAPGVYIPSFDHHNEPQNKSGTSFAAPFVTGSAALLRQAYPSISAATMKVGLLASANFSEGVSPTKQGNGILDVSKAFEILGNLSNSPLLTFAPRKLSSEFFYFGQAINGQTQIYNLGLYASSSCTLESMNVTNILPIQAVIPANKSTNLSLQMKTGYNLIKLSLSIPETLFMEKWGGNITFRFKLDNINITIDLEFPIYIENRYPGGRILFYQGYDNDSFTPDGPTGRFSQLHYYLEDIFGMQVTGAIRSNSGLSISGPLQETISSQGHISAMDLGGYDILVLADIEMGLTTEDINVIQKWVEEGHSLLVLSYPSYLSNRTAINALLKPYSLSIDEELMNRFSNASLYPSSPIGYFEDFVFDYNGTSVSVETESHAGVLATATDLLDNSKDYSVAGFWHNPKKDGKVVVFGSLDPFIDINYYSQSLDENFYVASQTFRWLIGSQETPMEVNLAPSPTVRTTTKIQISFPNAGVVESFNGTIVEANGSYTQITFKYNVNSYVGTWKPKKHGTAILWINLHIEGDAPSNGLFILTVYDSGSQEIFLLMIFGSFIIFAGVYYLISSRRTKRRLTLQEQLSMQYRKPNAHVGSKSLEPLEICSRCRTPRHDTNSKYCFRCGKEL